MTWLSGQFDSEVSQMEAVHKKLHSMRLR